MPNEPEDPLYEPTVDRQWVYQGGFLWIEKLAVRLPDGRIALREVAHTRDSVAVIPIDAQGNVHLIRQFRVAIDRVIHEIPAGLVDEGEDLETAAVRECEEEIGVRPSKLTKLTTFAHSEGFATGMMTVYLGQELEVHGKQKLDNTEFIEPVTMPLTELKQRIDREEIIDTKTILGVLLSEKYV